MDPETPAVESEQDSSEWKYDLLVDCLFTLGIALNVYIIVDVATDGQLTRDVKRIAHGARIRFAVLRHRNNIIRDAHEALYEEGTDNDRN